MPFFSKKSKKLTNYQLSKELPFFPNVEVADRISLSDSLFLPKSSIADLFKDLLKEKREFKYNLVATITLKRWNNAINRYDIETSYIRSEAITVINQGFNLNT